MYKHDCDDQILQIRIIYCVCVCIQLCAKYASVKFSTICPCVCVCSSSIPIGIYNLNILQFWYFNINRTKGLAELFLCSYLS